jgi:hypothetical protein
MFFRAKILSNLGVQKCTCIACVQKLTYKDIKDENQIKAIEMDHAGLLDEEVKTIRGDVERVAHLFDILNILTSPTSAERITAVDIIVRVSQILADHLMFPA